MEVIAWKKKTWIRWIIPASCLLLVFFLLGAHEKLQFEWIQRGNRAALPAAALSPDSLPPPRDELLGGLLSPNFDPTSCLSRFQSSSFRPPSPHLPSPYLLSRLRRYEALHKKCAPGTKLYQKSIRELKSDRFSTSNSSSPCNYIVWIPHYGLGNRVVSLVSSFFFALLNNRVLLIYETEEIKDLFCEPFPGTSWVLPSDFPISNLESFDRDSKRSYGNLIRRNAVTSLPAYVYLHLPWYYDGFDRLFFCEEEQRNLRHVPWVLLKSDHYFVPALFLVREYEEELRRLFPERTTVFHHLVRYLLHPSNNVWGHAMRYYHAYLAKADSRVGIQIRNLKNEPVTFDYLLDQIVGCSLKEGVLPAVVAGNGKKSLKSYSDEKVKAVFMTSLDVRYYERVRSMYYEKATTTGEVVAVYEPGHEVEQKTEDQGHNVRAMAEIVLLSFSDKLVTTACSTFGYVAQGLSGVVPLVMLKPWKSNGAACRWAESPEPCYLIPPTNVCNQRSGFNKKMAKNVRQCEDETGGVKLFD
ncbi:galactoside 2-alpha-L-fucosyltransferase-like [Zingiber officinale]|uniref:Fucosyltransferase n=1 Tax=Zingiber officinale TaxID=94328 RepID=A0A8J5HPJ5_ZINOF|nr:galactoside 2-alpha-L-fucosyltransferase-like [Zingiber officinale]KAG6528323.1 hypothetical protein ZIOFF_010476 [Zingiber officinale]